MNKVLRNIYYVIRIIIGICIILIGFQSCAHAWSTTKQDLTDKLEILGQKGVIGEYVFENINLNSYFSDNYSKYAIIIGKGTSGKLGRYDRIYIYMGNGTQIYNSSNDPTNQQYWNWAYSGGDYCCYVRSTGQQVSAGLYNLNDLQEPFYVYTTIPINTRVLTLGAGEEHGGHYFTSPFSFEIATTYSITDYKGYGQTNAFKYSYNNNQWLLGTMQGLEDITEVEFKLINLETNQNIAQCYKTGSISNMRISNNQLLLDSYIVYKDTPYRLYYDVYLNGEIIDSFWYNIVFLDRNAVITNGVITNYGSGDSYSTQNAINDLYNNNSGDSGIIQKIYKDLFTIDSGDVEDLYNKLEGKIGSGDSFIVFYEPLKSMLESEPDDFVISWTDIPIFLTVGNGETLVDSTLITSGDINFSKYCRDNIVLGNIKFYINTILSLFLIIMLFHDMYKVLLKALGLSTDIIDDMDSDESTTVYNSRTSLLDPDTSEVVQSGLVRRTVTSRRRLR